MRDVDKDAPKELRKVLRLASKRISTATRRKVPRKSGKARMSVQPRAESDGASIHIGGAKAPYYMFLDFGGTTGRGHRRGGGGVIKRPFIADGRYLYPTIGEERDDVNRDVTEAVEALIAKHRLDRRGL